MNHWRMFNRAWFARHQQALLWLLNARVVGWWFKWVLCIRPGDLGYRRRIARILPHAYEVANHDGTRTVDVRTHPKYAKRLYFAFWWLWWMLHCWDAAIANPLVPSWNAGFDTLTVFPDPDPGTTSMNGRVGNFNDPASWATLHDAASGTFAQNGLTTAQSLVNITASATAGSWAQLIRSIFLFDTSALTSQASVSAAVLSIYGSAKNDDNAISPTFDIYTATPGSNTAIATGDYSQLGTTSQTGSAVAYASIATTGYQDWTLNATGIGNVNVAGVSKFGLREATYDGANVAPTWSVASGQTYWQAFFSDATGTANDPKLVVTYALQGRNRPTLNQNKVSAVAVFSNSASTSLAFSSAVTAGQLLTCIVEHGSSSPNVSTITDTVNSSGKWKLAVRQRSTVAGSSLGLEIWYAPNSSGGTPTVTVAFASTHAGRVLFSIQSWDNASTGADVLGNTVSTAGNSSNLTHPNLTVSSASVVIAAWKTSAGVTNRTDPVGWSTLSPQNSTREQAFYQLQTSSGVISTQWQISAANQYVVALAEFRGSTFAISTVHGAWAPDTLPTLGVQ